MEVLRSVNDCYSLVFLWVYMFCYFCGFILGKLHERSNWNISLHMLRSNSCQILFWIKCLNFVWVHRVTFKLNYNMSILINVCTNNNISLIKNKLLNGGHTQTNKFQYFVKADDKWSNKLSKQLYQFTLEELLITQVSFLFCYKTLLFYITRTYTNFVRWFLVLRPQLEFCKHYFFPQCYHFH